MDMASGCLKQEEAGRLPARPVRGPHGGWQKQEIDLLQQRIDEAAQRGESLRSVFDSVSTELGRRPNSVRNFYYAQLRAQEGAETGHTLPFETFSQDEIEHLIVSVLSARAQGLSVRACVRQLAGGDRTLMLRYQNKYRSIVRTRPELVKRLMNRLSEQGVPFVSPYAGEVPLPQQTLPRLKTRAEASGDPQLAQLFEALDHLMDLALHSKEAAAAPAEDSEAQRKADRLSVRCDMLRIALDDEKTRGAQLRRQTEGMVTLIKEFIALPEAERSGQSADFCRQAAARLSAVECALMEIPHT